MTIASHRGPDFFDLKFIGTATTRGNFNSKAVPRFLRYAIVGACLGLGLFALHKASPFMPWAVATSQFVVPANCDVARARGIAPMRRGEPGYHRRLDADNNGIACEPLVAGGAAR
jgi:hypothetical protein